MKIIPAILVQSEEEFRKQAEAIRGLVDLVQLDIADGQFIPNVTWADPKVVAKYKDIKFELHLMVSNPEEEIKRWQNCKNVIRFIIHIETMKNNLQSSIFPSARAQDAGFLQSQELGLALNPETDISTLLPYIKQINHVLFMGVNPGWQGQKFIPEVLQKIKSFKTEYPDKHVSIDGAVNGETIPEIIKSGVDSVCIGSAIFGNNQTPKENLEKFKNIIKELTN